MTTRYKKSPKATWNIWSVIYVETVGKGSMLEQLVWALQTDQYAWLQLLINIGRHSPKRMYVKKINCSMIYLNRLFVHQLKRFFVDRFCFFGDGLQRA